MQVTISFDISYYSKLLSTCQQLYANYSKNLKLEADKIANADGRSLAGWIRKLVIDAVNEHNKSDTP